MNVCSRGDLGVEVELTSKLIMIAKVDRGRKGTSSQQYTNIFQKALRGSARQNHRVPIRDVSSARQNVEN